MTFSLSMHSHKYYVSDNTILAWIINDYHEQGNILIINLLLPLGHISNRFVTSIVGEVSLGPLGNAHHISLASIATNELVAR